MSSKIQLYLDELKTMEKKLDNNNSAHTFGRDEILPVYEELKSFLRRRSLNDLPDNEQVQVYKAAIKVYERVARTLEIYSDPAWG